MSAFYCPRCRHAVCASGESASGVVRCPHCGQDAPAVPPIHGADAETLAPAPTPVSGPGAQTQDFVPPARGHEAETLPPTPTPELDAETLDPAAGGGAAAGATGGPLSGRYELLGELGRGGMGVVYKARQRALGRLVAVKMVLAGGHAGPDELARFRTEAEAVARLQHPNIVQIHEVGEADGHPYFTLEYCPGGSLASRLDGTPWAPENAAELVGTLARAMQAAHAAGVIHRDLKPANVLLTADSTPKVTDFGLAKKLEEAEGRTESGVIMGTPIYMAPEQAAGRTREVGPAADVYALGAVLYELLTGRPPFKAATPLETIYQVIADEPVPPSRLQTGVPRDAETICLKCLHKEPARRYASAADLADDLARFLRHEPIRARSAGPLYRLGKFTRRHKVLVAALAAVFLALVGGVLGTGAGLVRAREEANRAWAAEVETERRLAAESEARRELSASYHEAARLVVRPRDWRLALTLIDKALVGDPSDSAELHLDKVRAWCALHELPKATEELESLAGRVGGTDLEGRVLLWGAGLALSRHDPDVGAVLGRVRQALDKGLPPAEAAYARALLARTSPEAVEYLKQSLRADPFNPQAHGLLTLLLGLLGRFDEARDNIRSAESLFPQNSLYGVIQAQLLALQDDSRAAGQQLERARPRLSAKQMESARAVVDLSGQLPALARVVEGNILNDPNASPSSRSVGWPLPSFAPAAPWPGPAATCTCPSTRCCGRLSRNCPAPCFW